MAFDWQMQWVINESRHNEKSVRAVTIKKFFRDTLANHIHINNADISRDISPSLIQLLLRYFPSKGISRISNYLMPTEIMHKERFKKIAIKTLQRKI